jgi:prepilin-type N-terminal cleavage/methylation domain-containing protein
MKTQLKAKFLEHFNQRRQDKGFTLIEQLVVIIIISILSAIALPAFLNQANKAKQSEAKQYIASINKGPQAYYAEMGVKGDIAKLFLFHYWNLCGSRFGYCLVIFRIQLNSILNLWQNIDPLASIEVFQ